MKTVKFLKSSSDQCRRKIVIAQINILRNLEENPVRHEKIVREVGKLHSLWFKGASKEIRIAELNDNLYRAQDAYIQTIE